MPEYLVRLLIDWGLVIGYWGVVIGDWCFCWRRASFNTQVHHYPLSILHYPLPTPHSQLGDDALLCLSDEIHNVLYLFRLWHLLFYLSAGIEHVGLSVEHQTVSIADVLQHLVGDAVGRAHCAVHATVCHRLSAGYDIWRNVFRECCSGLYHSAIAHTGARIFYHA